MIGALVQRYPAIGALPYVAVAVLSAAGAAWLTSAIKNAEIATLQRDHATAQLRAADAASVALYEAIARGDRLTRQLAAARRQNATLTKERKDAALEVTDGRVCLREPALRLLDGAPGLRVQLPGAAGGAAGADAGRVATDTGVFLWSLDAGAQYAECVRRLGALIDFHNKAPD